ncbi:MAG: hypothetical protein M3332_14955 [Actinomycetota bacterium]|nr:hypothetical protein [Actinomycetota bacterium]
MATDAVVQVLELIGHADWKAAVVLLLVLVWPWLRAHVRAGSVLVWDRKLRRTCIPADKRRGLVTDAAERYMLPPDKSAAADRGQEVG